MAEYTISKIELPNGDICNISPTWENIKSKPIISSPSPNGTSISFIDTIAQTNGTISATKKTVPNATTSENGLMLSNDKEKLDNIDLIKQVKTVSIEPVQSGSGDPSPTNVRPISGWTGANVVVSPTTDAHDGTTYPISWETEAGTVYGGTLDVTTGLLTVDRAMVDLGTLNWRRNGQGVQFYSDPIANAVNDYSGRNVICSCYTGGNAYNPTVNYLICIAEQLHRAFVTDDRYTDGIALKNALSGAQLVYELATPQTYQLTPNQILLLAEHKHVWADCGDITLQSCFTNNAANVTGIVDISHGGTGATSAADAWIALGGDASGKHADSYFVKAITSTDNAIVRFNGTSGQVQNSGVTIDDSNNITATKFTGPLEGNATTATEFSSGTTVKLTGDITGESSSSKKGWSIATTIGESKVTNAMLAGSIANGKLANSSIKIGNKTINLGETATLADIGVNYPVTGVKGNAESSYRTEKVNLTAANIGAVAKSGDTMTGNLTLKNPAAASNTQVKVETVRSSGSVTLRADNEGGNITILSPNGKQFEMDVYNDTTFRLYAYDDSNNFKNLTFSRTNGQLSTSGSIISGGNIVAGNASATYQAHATAQTVKGQYFIYCDGSSGTRGLWTINSAGTGAAVITTNDSNASTFNGNATNVTGTVAIANGGTGATTAANARSSLGITPANIGAKATQSAVSSPTASGTAAAFIDTISQNAQGVITATKKNVTPASIGAARCLNLDSSDSNSNLIYNELSKIQNGETATIYVHGTPFNALTGKTAVTTFGTVLRVTTSNFRFNLMTIAGNTSYGFQATVSSTSITHGTVYTYKGTE